MYGAKERLFAFLCASFFRIRLPNKQAHDMLFLTIYSAKIIVDV